MALNKIDPAKVFKTVSLMDPAIDVEATGKENMKKFEESYNMSFLSFKAGEHPTIFHVLNVLSSDEAKIKQDHMKIEFPELETASEDQLKKIKIKELKPKVKQVNSQEMMVKYFKAGVHVYEENGQVFTCDPDVFPFPVVQEIGSLIMMRTQVGEDLKNVLGS